MENSESLEAGVWRVGIHGARNTGKTCFLACLYGFRADGNGTVVDFTNDETIDYLKDKWDHYLAKGERPLPNPKGMPAQLRCLVKADKRVWDVSIRDYAGELVQRQKDDDVTELCVETRDWLKSCKAILLFIDVTECGESARERLNELNLLLAELHRLSADGHTIARPLGIVLTKWDSRPEFNVMTATAETEQEKARDFLQQHSILGQVSADIFESGSRAQLFPISAFGSHRSDNRPPSDGPKPFNIHSPLLWAIEQAEEMVVEKAGRDADRHLKRQWPNYSEAIAVLTKVKKDNKLSKGEAFDRLSKCVNALRRKMWLRRLKAMAVTCAVALVVSAALYYIVERGQYATLVRAYSDPSVSPDSIKDQTDYYLARRNPFKNLLGNESDIRFRWSELQERGAGVAYDNLAHFRDSHSSEQDAKDRLIQEERFLTTWGGSDQAEQVKLWESEDRVAMQRYEDRIKHDGDYENLHESVSALAKANKYAEAIEAYRRFLGKHPHSPFRTEIESSIADLDKSQDEHEWKKVVDYDQKNPNSFDETIKLAGGYLTNKNARHRADAESLLLRTENRWDRALYDDFCNACRTGTDANSLESTQRKATVYMTGTHPRKRMASDVQRWLNWFNALQQERDYFVIVRSMQIPKGSQLEPTLSDPECRIEVNVGGRAYWTDWCKGMSPVYGATLGPFRFKWGQTSSFAIHVEGYHPTWWNDHVHKPAETDDRFIGGRLNGPSILRDGKGQDVVVHLECDAVKPPSMPPFPDK